jgi:hypothetical protein
MNRFTITIGALLVAVVTSRFIAEAGLKVLTAEQKGHLIEALSGFRKYALVGWLGFVVLAYKRPWFMIMGVVAYLVAYQALTVRHAKRLSLPAAYSKYSIAASAVVVLGVSVYTAFIWGWL